MNSVPLSSSRPWITSRSGASACAADARSSPPFVCNHHCLFAAASAVAAMRQWTISAKMIADGGRQHRWCDGSKMGWWAGSRITRVALIPSVDPVSLTARVRRFVNRLHCIILLPGWKIVRLQDLTINFSHEYVWVWSPIVTLFSASNENKSNSKVHGPNMFICTKHETN